MSRLPVFALALSLCLLPSCQGCDDTYSRGERVGTVIKLSEKGVLFKSWEGELHLGGDALSATGANTWSFSCRNDEVTRKLQAAARMPNKPVRIVYKQWLVGPSYIDTGYEILDVQEISE
jgi:hypothetical protein